MLKLPQGENTQGQCPSQQRELSSVLLSTGPPLTHTLPLHHQRWMQDWALIFFLMASISNLLVSTWPLLAGLCLCMALPGSPAGMGSVADNSKAHTSAPQTFIPALSVGGLKPFLRHFACDPSHPKDCVLKKGWWSLLIVFAPDLVPHFSVPS